MSAQLTAYIWCTMALTIVYAAWERYAMDRDVVARMLNVRLVTWCVLITSNAIMVYRAWEWWLESGAGR